MIKLRFFLIFTLVFLSSFLLLASPTYRDKSLKKSEAPAFLLKDIPKENVDDIEFFKKTFSDGKVTYETKFEMNDDEEVSLTYSEDGKLLEREEDVKFTSIAEGPRKKIEAYLEKNFEKHRILETELRTDKEGKKFIDVEIAHKKGTGHTEVSFSPEGQYISEEAENAPSIETLN